MLFAVPLVASPMGAPELKKSTCPGEGLLQGECICVPCFEAFFLSSAGRNPIFISFPGKFFNILMFQNECKEELVLFSGQFYLQRMSLKRDGEEARLPWQCLEYVTYLPFSALV